MYYVMRTSAPSLYNVYRRYDYVAVHNYNCGCTSIVQVLMVMGELGIMAIWRLYGKMRQIKQEQRKA